MSSRTTMFVALVVGTSVLGGCSAPFEDRPWLVEQERLLAIVATPAEARPGQMVALDALVVDPEGTIGTTPTWSVCTEPRRVDERTAVTAACLRGEALLPVGNPMAVLSDACARFGPNPPPTMGDEPPRRPMDPDPSGGYFLPVGLTRDDGPWGFGVVRLRCDLAGVTRAVFEDYEARYVANENPGIESLATVGGAAVGAGDPVQVQLRLDAGAHEPYVAYVEQLGDLVERQEILTVRWYVSDGTLSRGQQRVEGTVATVEWTAPDTEGAAWIWAVVTDDRGGTAFTQWQVDVGE